MQLTGRGGGGCGRLLQPQLPCWYEATGMLGISVTGYSKRGEEAGGGGGGASSFLFGSQVIV
jgi:hypothetical protein